MKKNKTQKGITLIALIITIVVLLILAVVAIGAVQNDGIIEHAKNARKEYQAAQTNEQTALDNYLAKLDENVGTSTSGVWTQNKTTVTNGTLTLNVGDTVDYVSGVQVGTGEYDVKYETMYDYDENGEIIDQWEEEIYVEIIAPYEEHAGGWKVLGAENGKILLLSPSSVGEVDLFVGEENYYNDVGIEKINAACEGYNKGIGADEGTKSRSIKVEDINRITGYDPMNQADGKVYGEGTIGEYGNEVSYTLGADGDTITITVKGKPDLTDTVSLFPTYASLFNKPDGTTLKPGETYEAERNTYYNYEGKTYFPNTTNDPVYTMLFRNNDNTENTIYFLGSLYAAADHLARGGAFCVMGGKIVGEELWSSDECMGAMHGVRAVVSLESDVQLEENGSNAWEILGSE